MVRGRHVDRCKLGCAVSRSASSQRKGEAYAEGDSDESAVDAVTNDELERNHVVAGGEVPTSNKGFPAVGIFNSRCPLPRQRPAPIFCNTHSPVPYSSN